MLGLIMIWILSMIICGVIAKRKNRSIENWVMMCLFLTPLCLLILLAMPSLHSVAQERKCPFCAEWIKREAIVCKHCGKEQTNNEDVHSLPAKKAVAGEKIFLLVLTIVSSGITLAIVIPIIKYSDMMAGMMGDSSPADSPLLMAFGFGSIIFGVIFLVGYTLRLIIRRIGIAAQGESL